jgi:MSHA biogenesis protein MshO
MHTLQYYNCHARQKGFTLVELVAVIVLLGVIGVGTVNFIKNSAQGYNEISRRAEITDIGRFAIERVSRELRNALPGSIRVIADGSCVEFVPVVASSVYIDLPLSSASTTIDVADFINADSGNFSRIAIYTISPDTIYNPVSGTAHIAQIAAISAPVANVRAVTLTTANRFPLSSPGRRSYFVDQPVSFCVAAGYLNRYSNYGYFAVQSAAPATAQRVAEFIRLVDGGAVTPFRFSPSTGLQQNGVVHLDFRFLARDSGNEWMRFRHDVSVRGAP